MTNQLTSSYIQQIRSSFVSTVRITDAELDLNDLPQRNNEENTQNLALDFHLYNANLCIQLTNFTYSELQSL